MEDFIIVYGSVKEYKLNRSFIKKFGNVVVQDDGTTLGTLLTRLTKENEQLKAENLKLKEDFLKYQSESLSLFNKLNNNQETLVRKVAKLENSCATLLSNNKE